MRIFRRFLIASAMILAPATYMSAPADAFTCQSDIEPACQVAATVICKVVAKGQPCLY